MSMVCAWWVVIVSGEAVRPAALVIVKGGPTDAVCLDGSPPGVQDPSGNGADQVEAAHAWMLNVGELSDIVDTDSGVHIILRTAWGMYTRCRAHTYTHIHTHRQSAPHCFFRDEDVKRTRQGWVAHQKSHH